MNYLMLAAKKNSLRVAEYLLDEGIDEDSEDRNGETPLMYAVREGNIDMAKLLLKNGANKKIKNDKGERLLEVAKSNEMREFLLSLGLKW